MWDYTEKVMDHFLNPRHIGEMPDATAVGQVGNLSCGDALKLFLKIENNVIVDAKFQTFGCASAIASASALTEMIIGKTVEEAEKITNQDIANYLGSLPEAKMHCSVMGMEALEAALSNWRGESDGIFQDLDEHHAEEHCQIYDDLPGQDNMVCHCFGVTEAKIRATVLANHLRCVEDVTHYCKAGGACRGCVGKIQEILDDILKNSPASSDPDHSCCESSCILNKKETKLTNLQKMKLIQQTIDIVIRPGLQADGGDIELIDVDGNKVVVRLTGRCNGCPGAQMTLKRWVEAQLREKVSNDLEVIPE